MFQRYVLFATLGVMTAVLAACSNADSSTDPRTQPPLVRIESVESNVQSGRSFTGTIAARVQSDLGFRVPGKVLERLVDEGQSVRRGQALMRIDPVDLKLAMRAQMESVAAARAFARQTAEDEVRYRDLVAGGAVSASAYDKVKATAESAAAQLNAAEAQAEVARNESNYAVLLADADGVVVETLAEPGQVCALPSARPAAPPCTGAVSRGPRSCASCRTPRIRKREPSKHDTYSTAVWPARRSDPPSPFTSRTRDQRSPCRCPSARSSTQGKALASGWSRETRRASRGARCKSRVSVMAPPRSVATSRQATGSSHSARICCARANKFDWRKPGPCA